MEERNEKIVKKTIFGRRKGKPLRQGLAQMLSVDYPKYELFHHNIPSPIDLKRVFPHSHMYGLEIGFGGGEHLLVRAQQSPDLGFIGVEPFTNGMAKMVRELSRHDLENVRLYNGDARDVLHHLKPNCLDQVTILYPDPWPKLRHHKRRFVQTDTLQAVAKVLRQGGMLQIASDIPDYISWVLRHQRNVPQLRWLVEGAGSWNQSYEGWPGTRYEKKAIREGRKPCYLTFHCVASS
ncbi:MAG: tRNA (guanosine(46)-N7)-methyltransferase TrmB [Alphaproteobacteria bacterium]|nr:tRNA (guanosine(46)-N7)-methyltransferase TrmB [Alphaproteobacteria bacterium]